MRDERDSGQSLSFFRESSAANSDYGGVLSKQRSMPPPKNQGVVIYDLGANAGQNIPYYLLKADKVVAVEANPALANAIRGRFSKEISQKRLIVENVAVTEEASSVPIRFFLHREHHELGSAVQPDSKTAGDYELITIQSMSVRALVEKHGYPHYMKIDLEGLDGKILRGLFKNEIFPHFVSAEAHDPSVFGLLFGLGGYERFKIVNSPQIGLRIKELAISLADGTRADISFPTHSAGPFGEDIQGPWLSGQEMFKIIRIEGPGWYDIHVAKGPEPAESVAHIRVWRAFVGFSKLAFPRLLAFYNRVVASLRLVKGVPFPKRKLP